MLRFSVAVPAVVLALTGGLLTPALGQPAVPAAPAAAQVEAPVPVIAWGECGDDLFVDPDVPIECATVPVPLDYDEVEGPTVDLDVARVPAADQANRIGTLFVNPGGPGGTARDFAAYFGELVPQSVSDRFDVVGIDPRGVGPSEPMVCRTEAKRPPFPRAFFPTNAKQARQQIRFDDFTREACATDPAPIVGQMSTADTARDMDLVRQAVGDEQLTFYGISYGTQLGATYAAMFPDRVRAMIVDGVLDPVAWTTGTGTEAATRPFSERLGSGYGAWQSLTAAFAECDRVGPKRCPIAGRASQTWNDIVKRLEEGPFKTRRTGRITYDAVVGSALSSLYDQAGLRYLMRELRRTHRVMFERRGRLAVDTWDPRVVQRKVTGGRPVPGPYGPGWARTGNPFAGVACADSDNPTGPRAWIKAGNRADQVSPWFGKLWTWASSICARWPAATQEDRFTGPFEVTTSAPVLVVGNTYDPATPLHGARALNRMLGGSRLLVMDGWGHGALDTGACVGDAYAAYLVDVTLPAPGTVCRPGRPAFPKRR